MKNQILFTGMFIVLVTIANSAIAQRIVLDDSPSPRAIYELDLELNPQDVMRTLQRMLDDQNAALPPLTGFLPGYDVRLDTRDHVAKRARIYLRLPTAIPGTDSVGDITLSWQASGMWQSGSVSPGQEALLFEGTIAGPITGGVLNIVITVDTDTDTEFFTIEPIYEIEIIS